ncbi:MAG: outer membrane beta-barrel protein [Chitinophagaceae bacterium]
MEHINDNMDELFRKAADKYPLKTDTFDWNNVAKRLNESDAITPTEVQLTKQKSMRKFWLLLILFPLLLVGYFGYKYMNETNNSIKKPSSKNYSKTENLKKPSSSLIDKKKQQQADKKTLTIKNEPSLKKNNENKIVADNSPLKQKFIQQNKSSAAQMTSNEIAKKDKFIAGNQLNNNNSKLSPNISKTQLQPAINKINGNNNNQQNAAAPQATSSINSSLNEKNNTINLVNNDSAANYQQIKAKQKIKNNQSGFYMGLFVGPDVSTIKFQSIKSSGYSLGLLAGYQFNKYLSVETGVLWDKKKYYTEGKYFNKQRTSIPANVDLINMDGSCNMFEIPLNVKYNFAENKKGKFFVAAGLSSYIMKKENYDYLGEVYGQQYYSNKTYNNSTNNFFSVMHVSVGYEHKLNGIGNLRIEPYAKIPLSGIGIGKLPVLSTGLYIGITRSITNKSH